MKGILPTFILLAAALTVLTSCAMASSNEKPLNDGSFHSLPSDEKGSDGQLEPSKYLSRTINPDSNIIVSTDKKAYPVGTASVLMNIENRTDERIGYGTDYQIEIFHDGNWYQVPYRDDVFFTLIYKYLGPHRKDRTDVSVSTDALKFSLQKGRYRIVKEINNQVYAAEFNFF